MLYGRSPATYLHICCFSLRVSVHTSTQDPRRQLFDNFHAQPDVVLSTERPYCIPHARVAISPTNAAQTSLVRTCKDGQHVTVSRSAKDAMSLPSNRSPHTRRRPCGFWPPTIDLRPCCSCGPVSLSSSCHGKSSWGGRFESFDRAPLCSCSCSLVRGWNIVCTGTPRRQSQQLQERLPSRKV